MKLKRHSRAGGNPVQIYIPRCGQIVGLVLLRKVSSINWIPAFAGMTVV
ncbi:MAG: hypothetical protein PHQ60_01260 [Sideroxydans sp.]|nr:hypothetical protein [Sideroxydans sp.]